jgi:arylsulfatase A-like enzyme
MIGSISRDLFPGAFRKRMRWGGIFLLLFILLFLLTRGFIIFREGSQQRGLPADPAKNPANIIILLVDSLRPDHLSAYGYPLPTSPEIDRLAREGVLFRNCYAASNWTVPTHSSIFTGLYPSSHGNYSMYSSLDPTIPTLAQLLAGSGYRTASFFDNKLLGSRYGLARGFQTALGVDNEHKTSLTILRLWQRLRQDRSMSKTILQVAGQWIEYKPPSRQPFFLFVNFLDVHVPYRPRRPYIRDFLSSLPDKKVNIELARKFTTDEGGSKKAANELYLRLNADDWRWLERFYDSNIRAIDDQIHLFLKRLQAKGFLENTLVIITSDHGEFFGERGIGGHLHSSLHNAGLRIPLICWFPGLLAPQRVEQPVSQVDVFPTILDLAGLPAALFPEAQGRNLFSRQESRELLAEFWDDILKRFSRAFFSGDFKLAITTSGKKELYDLKNDPGEKIDLAQRFPGLLDGLASRLEKLLKSLPQRKSREEPGKKKDMEKMLKSLGYL